MIYFEKIHQNVARYVAKSRKSAPSFKKIIARPINTRFQYINHRIGIIAQNV